jgi:hypothetical protein
LLLLLLILMVVVVVVLLLLLLLVRYQGRKLMSIGTQLAVWWLTVKVLWLLEYLVVA